MLYGILAQYAFKCIFADEQCSKKNREKTGDRKDASTVRRASPPGEGNRIHQQYKE
ncbi:hypothetical protein NIES4073_59420 [Kalymmatonema gypsitolerans NIES-4073]|nr:hypothetical protein NIES4073_59420 [Scytonema sp. NIES-4073]